MKRGRSGVSFIKRFVSIIYGIFIFTSTLICYFYFDFHFDLVFAFSLSREEGLKRGFAALDVENTGRIPVDKFKRRLREVFEQRYCVFGVEFDICVPCVLSLRSLHTPLSECALV